MTDGAPAMSVEVLGPQTGRSTRSSIDVKAMSRRIVVSIAATVEISVEG